ncbi:hypothetical protein BCV69DRAFT_300758 [Microstroma glucosiphilum]|uniref:DRBM domain-containing protein n=1 Tax=Pseudomicrostroma glucosiphilum TaxID=1684307 RepID=A0A316U3B6_9BASI|nr:hypothetical protein BCV69DRAFT_300758 [Pseudomicrostroma glucosiphilum]PWN18971.1 hypothetical protein BCV69DRAFT_300758 [Pseudomicrostroma glucosiphilum]
MSAVAVSHPQNTMASSAGQKLLTDLPDTSVPAQIFSRPKAPVELLNALAKIGARPLEDYLRDLEVKATRNQGEKDALNRLKQAEEVALLKAAQGAEVHASKTSHGPSSLTPPSISPSPSPSSSPSPTPSSSPDELKRSRSHSSLDGLPLLAVSPSSRLGKKLCFTKTGHISELLQMEASRTAALAAASVGGSGGSSAMRTIGGVYTTGHPVSRLTEFAQQAGLNPPVFTSVARAGIHCSPDHYVTLVFEGHTFVDHKGKRNVRSGRECVAQQALDFFLGTRDEDDDDATKSKTEEEERASPTQLPAATAGLKSLSIDEAKASSPPTAAVAAATMPPPQLECPNPIGFLYETASRYNHAPPVFTYETKKGLHCSPDYYVQLTFGNHTFTDEQGQRSLKAGKELVALRAWEYLCEARKLRKSGVKPSLAAVGVMGVGRTAHVRMRARPVDD